MAKLNKNVCFNAVNIIFPSCNHACLNCLLSALHGNVPGFLLIYRDIAMFNKFNGNKHKLLYKGMRRRS